MKKYSVTIHEDAETEIREAFETICFDSPTTAKRWLAELRQAILSLETMPRRCAQIPESDDFEEELRQLLHYSHRIIFLVEDDHIEVLYFRHGARDTLRPTE